MNILSRLFGSKEGREKRMEAERLAEEAEIKRAAEEIKAKRLAVEAEHQRRPAHEKRLADEASAKSAEAARVERHSWPSIEVWLDESNAIADEN